MHTQIVVAGVSSGVGKTTITTGLIAALRQRGLSVQPFKAGPDYIDPTYHTLAAGRPCRNIDTWMIPADRALALFTEATRTSEVAIVEGVMGVFDGFSYTDEEGSTAQIAKLLNAPVLLILDVGKMARSAGALALGYTHFDSNLKIAGFILNRCGSENHYSGVKLAVEQATDLPVLGWLPKDANLHIPERHLGLVPTDERGELTQFIQHATEVIEQHFDLDRILAIGKLPGESWQTKNCSPSHLPFLQTDHSQTEPVPIAVARDAAFSFYYEDNLDLLRAAGAEICFFSPQQDSNLPAGTSGVYLGGGFPEIYAAQLAANESLQNALRYAYMAGMPIYAECGGFMYLTEAIIDLEDQYHPMVGLIPGVTHMQPHLVSLGYRLVESPTGNFLLPKGMTTRGHEFHWSTWKNSTEGDENYSTPSPAWYIRPRSGEANPRATGYATGNLIASYVHLHFAHNLRLAHNFVQASRRWMQLHGA